jgi:hypothetical protein
LAGGTADAEIPVICARPQDCPAFRDDYERLLALLASHDRCHLQPVASGIGAGARPPGTVQT